jgi:hypothetical protein
MTDSLSPYPASTAATSLAGQSKWHFTALSLTLLGYINLFKGRYYFT